MILNMQLHKVRVGIKLQYFNQALHSTRLLSSTTNQKAGKFSCHLKELLALSELSGIGNQYEWERNIKQET
jgi:hypothetical protein